MMDDVLDHWGEAAGQKKNGEGEDDLSWMLYRFVAIKKENGRTRRIIFIWRRERFHRGVWDYVLGVDDVYRVISPFRREKKKKRDWNPS